VLELAEIQYDGIIQFGGKPVLASMNSTANDTITAVRAIEVHTLFQLLTKEPPETIQNGGVIVDGATHDFLRFPLYIRLF
jgi:hypothetical protein